MKTSLKKTLSMFLAVVMLVGMFPVNVFAGGTGSNPLGPSGDLVEYTVYYVDGSGNTLRTADTYEGTLGTDVDSALLEQKITGYSYSSASPSTLTLDADESKNVITLTYADDSASGSGSSSTNSNKSELSGNTYTVIRVIPTGQNKNFDLDKANNQDGYTYTISAGSDKISQNSGRNFAVKTGVSAGDTAKVTATKTNAATYYYDITFVNSNSVTTITASVVNKSLYTGESTTATATKKIDNSTPVTVTPTWASSDTSVAIVDASGKITALKAGTAKITATYDGITTSAITVTVSPASMSLSKDSAIMTVGDNVEVSVTSVTPPYSKVIWSSNDESVAKVNNGVITAVAAGKAIITASTPEGASKYVAVVVRDFKIIAEPKSQQVVAGETAENIPTVIAYGEIGVDYTVTAVSSNSSKISAVYDSNSGILTIDASNASAEDTATITLSLKDSGGNEKATDTIAVTVVEPSTDYVEVIYKNADGDIIKTDLVEKGKSVTLPSGGTMTGYTFDGWSYSQDTDPDTRHAAGSTVTIPSSFTGESVTFRQTYKKVGYTVSFSTTYGTKPSDQSVKIGESASKPTFAYAEGDEAQVKKSSTSSEYRYYRFLGWYNGDEKYNFNDPVESDLSLTAKWEMVKCTIYFMCATGEKASYTVEKGSSWTGNAPRISASSSGPTDKTYIGEDGYYAKTATSTINDKWCYFRGWAITGNSTMISSGGKINSFTVTSDVVYNAVYEPEFNNKAGLSYHGTTTYITVNVVDKITGQLYGQKTVPLIVTPIYDGDAGATNLISEYSADKYTKEVKTRTSSSDSSRHYAEHSVAKFGKVYVENQLGENITVNGKTYDIDYSTEAGTTQTINCVWLCSQDAHVYGGYCGGGCWTGIGAVFVYVLPQPETGNARLEVNYYLKTSSTTTEKLSAETASLTGGKAMSSTPYIGRYADKYGYVGLEWAPGAEQAIAEEGQAYVLNVYYKPAPYTLTIDYINGETGETMKDASGNDMPSYVNEYLYKGNHYGVISPDAPDGYYADQTSVSGTMGTQDLTFTVKYLQRKATIKYVAVGPTGSGTVSVASETVKVVTGTAKGSTATTNGNEYRFVGWFDNEECTGTPVSTSGLYVPTKADTELWTDRTYYAKFEPNDAAYTINYYLKGTTTKVADSYTSDKQTIGKTVGINGDKAITYPTSFYTEFSGKAVKDSESPEIITISSTAANNVINVYYTLPITITTESATRTYNGSPLTVGGTVEGIRTADEYTFTVTGSQTDVGTSTNTYALTWGSNGTGSMPGYYTGPTETLGLLTVTKEEMTVTGTNDSKTYDGSALQATAAVPSVTSGTTVTYSLDNTTWSAELPSIGPDVTAETTVYVKAENPNYEPATCTFTLEITPAEYWIVTETASKTYDGDALTAPGTVNGLVNGETATVATTGSQTEVGSSSNTYGDITWSTAKSTNYTHKAASDVIGLLTVTKAELVITVTAEQVTETYDGKTHEATEVTYAYKSGDEALYNENLIIRNAKKAESVDPVIKKAIGYTAADFSYDNANIDVTFEVTDGWLTVIKNELTVEKVAKNGLYTVGDTIEYTVTVTNTGNRAVKNIEVKDLRTDATLADGETGIIAELAPGASAGVKFNYVVKDSDVNGIKNTAKATGEDPDGNKVEGKDDNTVNPEDPKNPTDPKDPDKPVIYKAKLDVEKTAEPGLYTVGDTIEYTVKVTNSGNVTVKDIKVTDNRKDAKLKDGQTGKIASLAPTESASVIFTYVVTEADVENGKIENTATAKGKDPNEKDVTGTGNETVNKEDPIDPTDPKDPDKPVIYKAKLTVEKVAKNGLYTVGDTIVYTVKVTNTGNVTVKNITVTDNRKDATLADGETGKIASLAPGEDAEVKFTYTVTEDDVNGIENKATAIGEDPKGKEVKGEGDNKVNPEDPTDPTNPTKPDKPVIYVPGMTVKKEITNSPKDGTDKYAIGEDIAYKITVKNTGDVKLTNVKVEDSLTGFTVTAGSLDIGTLEVGEEKTVEGTYTVTEADAKAGKTLLNKATATGKDPNNKDIPDPPSGEIPAPLKGVVNITAEDKTKTYDGLKLASPEIKQTGTTDDLGLEYSSDGGTTWTKTAPTITEVSVLEVEVRTTNKDYNVDECEYTLEVTPAEYWVVTASDSKVYDGTPLTNDKAEVKGLVKGETATVKATGSQTLVGISPNTYGDIDWGSTNPENYIQIEDELGILEVTEFVGEITVKTVGGTKMYDGTPLQADVKVSGLPAGYTVSVAKSNARVLHVSDGTVKAKVDKLVILNPAGVDVTDKLNIKKTETATVSITPRPVTLGSGSAEKVYDGTPVTSDVEIIKGDGFVPGEGVIFDITGSQLDKGKSRNEFTFTAKPGTDLNDYVVTKLQGMLTITVRHVTLTSPTAQKRYDGKPLTAKTIAVTEDGWAKGEGATYTVTGSQTDAGESENTFTYRLKSNTKPENYVIKTVLGTLTVTTDRSKEGNYTVYYKEKNSGTELAPALEATGLPFGGLYNEKAKSIPGFTALSPTTQDVKADGSEITFWYSVNNVNTAIKIIPDSATKMYDGTPLTKNSYSLEGRLFSGASVTDRLTAKNAGTVTHVAEGEVENTVESYQILRTVYGGTIDVTDKYTNVTKGVGKLSITPRPVTLGSGSAEKVYDGTPVTSDVEIIKGDGFVSGEGVIFSITGSQLDKGKSRNEFTFTAKPGTDLEDYAVTQLKGMLTITVRHVTLTSPTAQKTYDGTALTAKDIAVTEDGWADGEGAKYDVTGSQTDAGESENTFTYRLNSNTKAENYVIKTETGILTVTAAPAKEGSYTVYYKEQTTGIELAPAFKAGGLAYGDLYTEKAMGIPGFTALNPTEQDVVADGSEITFWYSVNNVDTALKITPDSASKMYDGKPLEKDSFSLEGKLFSGATANATANGRNNGASPGNGGGNASVVDRLTAKMFGSVTHVAEGEVENTVESYQILRAVYGGTIDVTDKYTNVIEGVGKLSITPRNVLIAAGSDVKVYDGKPLTCSTEIIRGDGFVDGEGVKFNITGTQLNVGESRNLFTYVLTGLTQAEDYNITEMQGMLTVTERYVRIVSHSATRGYDGTPLTCKEYTQTGDGWAEGEGAKLTWLNSITNVGSVDNAFEIMLNKGTDPKNYNIEYGFGKLKIVDDTGIELTIIEDLDVPLARFEGTHKDCLIPFLCIFLSFLTQLWYNKRRKEYQEDIWKMKYELLGIPMEK